MADAIVTIKVAPRELDGVLAALQEYADRRGALLADKGGLGEHRRAVMREKAEAESLIQQLRG